MSQRKPLSFTFFIIVVAFIVFTVIPAFFVRASESPTWFSISMFIGFVAVLLLTPATIVIGLVYKTDNPQFRSRNLIGLWGAVAIALLVTGAIIYASMYEQGGSAPML